MGLRAKLFDYVEDIRHDFDKEEISNFIEILSEIQNEDLSDMSYLSQKLLLRLINDDDLYRQVNDAKESIDSEEFLSDPFE